MYGVFAYVWSVCLRMLNVELDSGCFIGPSRYPKLPPRHFNFNSITDDDEQQIRSFIFALLITNA